VQYAPELFTYVKIYTDEHQRPGDFWLTGSQLFPLMEGVQESLAGRVALLTMLPMSQAEIAGAVTEPFVPDFNRLSKRIRERKPADIAEVYERMMNGGMPGLVSGRFQDRSTLYSGYVSTYIDRDVRELSGPIDSLVFREFFVAAAALAGQMLNISTIAANAGIDHAKAKGWLALLERLGIVFLLHPYSNNALKRLVKSPKLYFYDSGLVAHLTRWSSAATLMNGAMSGAMLENFVVSEIVKSYTNVGLAPSLYYYRDRDAKEIDLLLEADGTLFPMEIKKTADPDARIVRSFRLIDEAPLRRGTGLVLCTCDRLSAIDSDHLIYPVWGI